MRRDYPRNVQNIRRFLALSAGIAGFVGTIFITAGHGPGLDPDSMGYVGAATSLAAGNGLRVPLGKWQSADSSVALTVWPPAYPVAIAAVQKTGVGPLTSARLVNAAAAFITLAGAAVLLFESVSIAGACVALLVIAVTPSFVAVHLNVLSEPLFLACIVVTLIGMVRNKPSLSAVGATLAVLTRYAGVAAGAAAAVWFLVFSGGTIRDRLRRAVISALPAGIAALLWMAHNARVATVQSRLELAYHPGIGDTFRQGAMTIAAWLAPGAIGPIALVAVAIIAALVVPEIRTLRKSGGAADTPALARSAAVMLACYLAVVIASRLFVGGGIEFDERILSPAILLLELILAPLIYNAVRSVRLPLRAAAGAVLLAWIGAAAVVNVALVRDSIDDGNDLASSDWRDSPTMHWIATDGKPHRIYTNWPSAVYFNANRPASDIPTSAAADTLAAFRRSLEERNGLFVAFDVASVDYPPSDAIAKGAGLTLIKRLPDGSIWGVAAAQRRGLRPLSDASK